MDSFQFLESKLLGIEVDEVGKKALFKIKGQSENPIILNFFEIEKLLVSDFRHNNIIDEIFIWPNGSGFEGLRHAAFLLFAESDESLCGDEMRLFVQLKIDKIVKGDLMLMDITAIYGAQILIAFKSLEM